jgi:membrane protease YdiL (CAAX protease family)
MNMISLPTKRPFSWRVFLFVLAFIVPATFAALPYALTLVSATLEPGDLPRVILSTLVNALIYGVLAGIGLFLAGRIGLGLPFIEGWLKKEPIWDRFRGALVLSVTVGVVASLIILGLGLLVFKPPLQAELDRLGITLPEDIQPPPWQGFLASFYGGITEEVLLRLFLLTLLAWLGSLVSRDSEGRPTPVVFWVANILAAVIFGLGHLPATAAIGLPLTVLVITRAIVLNGLGGLAFGWLYWTRGLESAVLAHFSADIVLHVITPLVAMLVV